eukprot:m.75005 g.75005  ORF g.75005 m.75005 type:complete len:62 (-) comp14390_c0_seq3:92-277(-)
MELSYSEAFLLKLQNTLTPSSRPSKGSSCCSSPLAVLPVVLVSQLVCLSSVHLVDAFVYVC